MHNSDINNIEDFLLVDIIGIMLRNIKIIISITLFVMVAVLSVSIISILQTPKNSILPNVYSPKTLVLINSSTSSSGLDSMLSGAGLNSLGGLMSLSGSGSITDAQLAIQLSTTNRFIDKIADEFNLFEIYELEEAQYPKTSTREEILSRLNVTVDAETNLLRLSYTDIDKELATKIVNRATSLLEEEFSNIDNIKNRNQTQLVNDKINTVSAELKSIQNQINDFQLKNNIMNVTTTANEITKQITNFQSQLLKKEVEIESYGKVSNVKDPGYMRLLNEKEAILNAINKLEQGEIGDFPPIKDLPQLAQDLQELEFEATVKLEVYKTLVQQAETLKITADGVGPTLQVIEYAEIPEIKSGPSRGMICIITTIAGFILSIFVVFIKESYLKLMNDKIMLKRLKGEY